MSNEILTPVGRMVQGHPMELHPVTDRNNVPKINKRGEAQQQAYVGLAIKKNGESHWNQTDWGAQIWAAGQAGWPSGEWQFDSFAWKVTDGDSVKINKRGKRPCDQEGFPGHWIIGASNGFMPDCFANRNYSTQVMRKETFKRGDYIRLCLSVKPNDSTESPGIYVNMLGCELIQAGVEIVGSSFDAQGTFGATPAATLPEGAQVDPNMSAPASGAPQQTAPAAPSATPATGAPAAPPAAPVPGHTTPPPAPDFLTVNGQQYTADQLRAGGWTEDQINAAR